MSSVKSWLVENLLVKGYMGKIFDPSRYTIEEIRQKTENLAKKIKTPSGTIVERINIKGLPAEWIRANNIPNETEKVILYFHSGGFCLGYSNSHRELAARISKESGVRVLALEYRLAPEYKYPAANEDCLTAYRWLIDNGFSADKIIMGGDSAGAGLALMTLLTLRDTGEKLPAAAFLLSLFGGDLIKFNGESYNTRKKVDPLNNIQIIKRYADYYFGSSATKLSVIIDEDLSGLPDLLIQVGDHEVLLSDSLRLAERAKAAGVDVTLEVWKDMWHAFQGFASMIPEANQAIINIGEFIKKKV